MLYELPFWHLNFTQEEWNAIPRGNRTLIRDFILNGYNREKTLLYNEYETDFQLRTVEKKYNLHNRPRVIVRASDLCLAE